MKSADWAPSAACRNFDDLLFLAASLSRYPLEGYRERCATKTVLGTRFATQADRARDSRSRSPA